MSASSSSALPSFYTCTTQPTPTSLLTIGATPLALSYTYEIDTPTLSLSDNGNNDMLFQNNVAEAVEYVQREMARRIAERGGLVDCAVLVGDGGSWRRRLAPGKRGGTSIVGLSAEPADQPDAAGELWVVSLCCGGSLPVDG